MEEMKCEICNGEGIIENPNFEACIDPEHEFHDKLCSKKCPDYEYCSEGEFITCWNCDGKGFIFTKEGVEKTIDIALKELIKQINCLFKPVEDLSSYNAGWNDALTVIKRKIERKYLKNKGDKHD